MAGNGLEYGPQGRLERVVDSTGSPVASFRYGVEGRRVMEATSAGSRTFQYGPDSFVPYVVGNGSQETNHVIHGGALLASMVNGVGFAPMLGMGTNSPSVTSAPTGALDGQFQWNAHGEPFSGVGSPPEIGWHGLLASGPDLPFLAAAARDYDPTTGTWLQPDPLGVDGGINLYQYAGADPVNRSDPSGLCVDAIPNDLREQMGRRWFAGHLAAQGVLNKTGLLQPLRKLSICEAIGMMGGNAAGCARAEQSKNYFNRATKEHKDYRRDIAFALDLKLRDLTPEMIKLHETLLDLEWEGSGPDLAHVSGAWGRIENYERINPEWAAQQNSKRLPPQAAPPAELPRGGPMLAFNGKLIPGDLFGYWELEAEVAALSDLQDVREIEESEFDETLVFGQSGEPALERVVVGVVALDTRVVGGEADVWFSHDFLLGIGNSDSARAAEEHLAGQPGRDSRYVGADWWDGKKLPTITTGFIAFTLNLGGGIASASA
jgi:RHS repeat-associated protein